MPQGASRTAEIPFDWHWACVQDARRTLALLRAPIARAAHSLDCPVRLVGGWVRDLLLIAHNRAAASPRRQADVDLVVEGDARALGRRLQAEWGGALRVHDPFLTATWHPDMRWFARHHGTAVAVGPDIAIDLITARSETYPRPGQLPRVTAGTFAQDTVRRDISINTFALALEDWPGFQTAPAYLKVHCHPEALTDLRNGCVRLLHAASLQDDPTRIFRMARYEQRLGFQLASETADWLVHAMQQEVLGTVTPERIRLELEQVLGEDRVGKVVRRLHAWGVLRALGLHPDPERLWSALDSAARHPRACPEAIWLLLLGLNQNTVQAHEGLKLSGATAKAVAAFRQLVYRSWHDLRPSQVWQRLKSTSPAVRRALQACLPAHAVTLDLYEHQWQHVTPHVSGKDLVQLGYRPGPRFGPLLEQLRCKTLDGELHTRAQELAWVQRTLGPPPGA